MTFSRMSRDVVPSKSTDLRFTTEVPHLRTPLRRDLSFYSPQILWKGSISDARIQFGDSSSLTPFIELLSYHGSMTKQLEAITNGKISVQETHPVFQGHSTGLQISRSVVLVSSCKQPLLYAQSWWDRDIYEEIMIEPKLPIWYNLQKCGIKPTRNVEKLFISTSPILQMKFGSHEKGFIGRQYLLHYNKQTLTKIIEILAMCNLGAFF
eukprot:g3078.t1